MKNLKFLLQYHENDSEGNDTAISNTYDEYLNGEFKLLDVTTSDFVDSRIEVLYSDHDDNEEKWLVAEVADIDVASEDKNNPGFYVYYDLDESSETEIIEKEYFLEPFIELNLNGRVFGVCKRNRVKYH